VITPASTNLTAVLGSFARGPLDEAVLVSSWDDFAAQFGAADDPDAPFGPNPSLAVYAVWQLFQGGGIGAWIVRLDTSGDAVSFQAAAVAELGGAPSRLDRIAPRHFNLMCIPELVGLSQAAQEEVFAAAHAFCSDRHAFFLLDPPPSLSPDALLGTWGPGFLGPDNVAGATYYPWVEIADPWNGGVTRAVPPSGTVAGVYASTDLSRGVWKAPAGVLATLEGVTGLADETITDAVGGELNVVGINCLRTFPLYGSVVWGARTLAGADVYQSPFKYVPVRRLTDFVELSLSQGLAWAASEPNGPPLWSSLVNEAAQFMAGLFGAGAFAGTTPSGAYGVACDASTTSPADMLAGIVNVTVWFAPVVPAEFVVANIALSAGPPAGG
jgi:phage tail sheath protein FI